MPTMPTPCARPTTLLRGALFASLALSPIACSGGGTGRTSIAPAPSRASDLRITFSSDDEARIDIALSAPEGRPVDLVAEFSEDLGRRFAPATLADPPAAVVPNGPSPAPCALRWRFRDDLSRIPQGDVVVRVTPRDRATGRAGEPAVSPPLEIGSTSPPRVLSVEPPGPTAGARVPIAIRIADDEADSVTLDVRYRIAAEWVPARGADPGAPVWETSPEGVAHRFVWDASELGDGIVRQVQVRVAAADARPGEPAVSAPFDLNLIAPEISLLTIEDIPAEMAGSIPCPGTDGQDHPFHLAVPPSGFSFGIEYGIRPGGAAIEPTALRVSIDCPLGGGPIAGGLGAGAEIGGRFQADARRAVWEVPASHGLPAGVHTIRASIGDRLGNRSAEASLLFEVVPATPANRPFDAIDRWYLDVRRDNFAIASRKEGDEIRVDARYGPNGIPDLFEDLAVVGLRATQARADAAGASDRVTAWILDEIVTALGALYGEIDEDGEARPQVGIRFSIVQPSGPHSRIAIGGDDVVPGYTIGRAYFDHRNAARESNIAPDLGIFTTNLIQFYINSSMTFRTYFDPLAPGRGIPVGEHPLDGRVLAAEFDRLDPRNAPEENARFDRAMAAAEAFARAVATIAAHEIGHSVGLVANGQPPSGLFGGETAASFAGPYTNAYHLDTPGNNIMAAAIGFGSAIARGAAGPRFNELNWAYLRERILLK